MYAGLSRNFVINSSLQIAPHLKRVATLSRDMYETIFEKYIHLFGITIQVKTLDRSDRCKN